MKVFNWDSTKNSTLKSDRGVSFEQVLIEILSGRILDIFSHPNSDRYPNQKIFVVVLREYCYLVPFVENEKEVFLKTIIPSRKATKKYLDK